MRRASDGQLRVLEAIKAFIAENNYSPTTAELAAALGLNSRTTVVWHLMKMRDKGMITFEPAKPRTIAVCEGW